MELALAIVTPDAVAHVAEILEMLGAASVPVKQQFRLALSAKQADALLPTVVEMPGKQEDDDAESVQQPDAKGGKGGKGGKADKAGKAAKGGSKRGGAPAAAAEPEPADATVDPAEQEARRRELAEKYRADLLTHLASGPVTALVMRGVGACKALRQVAGGRFGPDPEGLTVRERFGVDPVQLALYCSPSAAEAARQLKLVIAWVLSEAKPRAEVALGVQRSAWVELDALLQFLFPPRTLHPRATGRLLLFGTFGPLDADGALRGGPRGGRLLAERELRTMVEVMEEEDALAVFVGRAHLSNEERAEVLRQTSPAMRQFSSMSQEEVRAMFADLPRNAEGLLSFHDMQRAIQRWRQQRVRDFRRMYPDLVRPSARALPGATTRSSATMERTGSTLGGSMGGATDGKVDDSDMFVVTHRLLHRLSHRICNITDGNRPELTSNVFLMRGEEAAAGREALLREEAAGPRWDATCCLRGTGKPSFVGTARKRRGGV